VALIEQSSFTRAARVLNLSQSTVSGHIADLERRLGVRLVDRERNGVRPTAAGQALLKPARDVLSAERGARMAVEELSGLITGSLTVGGSTIPSCYLLPPIVARFHTLYPGVVLRLVTGDSREIVDRVCAAEVEVGVVGMQPPQGNLVTEPLGRDRLVLIVAPGHPLARKRGVTIPAVAEHPLVLREQGSGTRSATDRALREALPAAEIKVVCEVGSTEALKAAVRAGLGAAFISDLAVRDEIEAGTLVAKAVKDFEVERSFSLVSRAESLLSPAARAFREIALDRS